MVKINLKDCKPVQVRANGLVLTSGGHLRKEYPLHTKDVKIEGSLSVATFVWINPTDHWLSYAVGRPAAPYFLAGLRNHGLLAELRYNVVSAEQRLRWELEGVSRGWCHPCDQGVDPMDEMEDGGTGMYQR